MAESVSQDLPQTKPHINNNSELNPLSNSLQELEKSLTECDTQSSEESLIVAAKIGSALLQENNYLKNENRRLQDKLNSLEAKVEELENCEGKYVAHMERLQEKISELEAQLTKEKLYVVEAQTIFEDHDGKQIELIKDYENKIEELESKIMTLQQQTPEKTDRRLRTTGTQTLAPDYQTNNTFPSVLLEIGLLKNSHNAMEEKFKSLEAIINTSTQTSIEVTPPPAPQSLSVNSEMLILKRRQDQLEQQMSALLDNTHLHLNESGRILPTNFIASKSTQQCKHKDDPLDSTLNKSTSGNKRKSGVRRDATGKNLFSVSLQAQKYKNHNMGNLEGFEMCNNNAKASTGLNIGNTLQVTSVLDTHRVAKASVIKPPMNARSRTKDESIEEFYTTNIDYYISIMTNNQLPNADCIESNSFTFNSRPPISQQSPFESGQRSPPRAEDEQHKYFLDKTGLSNFKMKTALPYPN
ncbi:hypothetical protein J6590_072411 [Homalodisca vitripennis]|nr:hypothetical protein J6590_072411 [Homalodisca vitripennis]